MTASWMEDVRSRLARPWPESQARPAPQSPPRKAAVLVPLYVKEKGLWILLTKRTAHVEQHKGQISFPGGTVEAGDESLWATAVRETEEEIGVPREVVRHLGALPHHVTITDFEIAPFAGAIPYPLALTPHDREVEAIIEVPMAHLLDSEIVEERPIKWQGRVFSTLVYHYRGHAIWGATARILADLLTALREDVPAAKAPPA